MVPINQYDVYNNQRWHGSISFLPKLLNIKEYVKSEQYNNGYVVGMLREQIGKMKTMHVKLVSKSKIADVCPVIHV